MESKYGEFTGVESLYVAKVTADTAEAYITDTPEYLAPTATIAQNVTVQSNTPSYDNVPGDTYIGEGVTVITIAVSGVPAMLVAKLLGKKYDTATGRVLDNGVPNPPKFALSFKLNIGAANYRYYQYLKGTFSGGAEEAETRKEGNVTLKTYTLTYTAVVTTHKWSVDGVNTSLKRIFADTTDAAFTSDANWFAQVQTPSTASAPSALTVAISPSEGDNGVAANEKPTLTFNNKITECVCVIMQGDDVVSFSSAWNAAGTVLTLTPTSNFTASTEYAIVVVSAKDIFGQSLGTVTKASFTTAAG